MKSKNSKISRRQFVKNLGTGVVGTAALAKGLHAYEHGKPPSDQDVPEKEKIHLSMTVNGKKVGFYIPASMTLAQVLRERLKLTGTKITCNHGACGACTVVLNGQAVYSCHMLAADAEGKEVVTIEGLMDGEQLHPIQEAFVDKDGMQCGFCTPGQIMAAYALIINNPSLTDEDIKNGMSGNLCRCAAYPKIIESVREAAKRMPAR